ncbi:hypothetical protein, conserved [Entamoeba dispar SAW760]|uniref:Uncharacterized protein n=1 Tax=Entamoeba dispar (strain ATCC PRA-260 / SAW760) TaxID=370354 RepID=B0EV55_ENTDS|nr:uncharacterized protein EDI_029540 [Entamoeba dispar SAW760]EDR21595.1 hypothetical protein, conserved [Entamoeba dispar SAW760]|eukprot:EDR21595.1 hypothetical protein, conserved [Entamoeba dispar SAW760]
MKYQAHSQSTTSIHFLNKDQGIVSTSADGTLVIRDLIKNENKGKFVAQKGGINDSSVLDETTIFVVGEDDSLWQVDTRAPSLIKKIQINPNSSHLCVSCSSCKRVAVSTNNLINLYDPTADKIININQPVHSNTITSLCFSGVLLQSSSLDGTIVRTFEDSIKTRLPVSYSPVLYSDFPHWDISIGGFADGNIVLYKMNNIIQTWKGYQPNGRIVPIKPFDKDFQKFVSGSDDGTIKIYSVGNEEPQQIQKELTGSITSIDCNDTHIVIGGVDPFISFIPKSSLN